MSVPQPSAAAACARSDEQEVPVSGLHTRSLPVSAAAAPLLPQSLVPSPSSSLSSSSARTLHLILDLDGTLVLEDATAASPSCFPLRPRPRPHLGAFLARAFELCASVSLWTAASEEWLGAVTYMLRSEGLIQPHHQFLLQWHGKRCRLRADRSAIEQRGEFYPGRVALKPLLKAWRHGPARALGMCRRNTLIVDDTPASYAGNYGNALGIRCFDRWDDGGDEELRKLAEFLPELNGVPDVRVVEKRGWSSRFNDTVHGGEQQADGVADAVAAATS